VAPSGWEVGGARQRKSLRKLRVGGAAHNDTRNVLAAALDAKEAGCDVLAFSRDRDSDQARVKAVGEGMERVPSELDPAPAVIGGVAIQALEGWILAMRGERGTESLGRTTASEKLATLGVEPKDGARMVLVVEDADLDAVPDDATSLKAWLSRAEAVLPALVAERRSARYH
jgi:hypothetical protein